MEEGRKVKEEKKGKVGEVRKVKEEKRSEVKRSKVK